MLGIILILCAITTRINAHEDNYINYSVIPENDCLLRSVGVDEEALMNFTQLATKYNYTTEEHTVTTEDGYILKLFRLGTKKCKGKMKPYPIYMMHGLVDTSDTFIITGPEYGLGYILADQCYDVWIGNIRGNVYGRQHCSLNPDKDGRFWDYTYDEHGYYDVPALIDYTLDKTNSDQLIYIGHSQGCVNFFVALSTRPEYNDKIKFAIHLAPATFMTHAFTPILRLLSDVRDKLQVIAEVKGLKEVGGRREITYDVLVITCRYFPELCAMFVYYLSGHKPQYFPSMKSVSKIFGHDPSGVSINNLLHFAQALHVEGFVHYDMGRCKNIKKYGCTEPPPFNLTKVTAPVAILCGEGDFLVAKDDAVRFSKYVNTVELYIMPPKDWSHIDFIWSRRLPTYLKPKVLKLLDKYGSKESCCC